MNNKNIIIIVLVCIIIALSTYMLTSNLLINQNQTNHPINSTNNTTASLNVERIAQEDESSNSVSSSSSSGIHKEHLKGGDVAVDSNGMVVGHYYPNGDYIEGGQLEGMSIEDARAFDEHVSKYGME